VEGKMKDRLLLSLFYLLPKHALSKAVGRWARSPISRYAIPLFIRRFRVNLEEAEKPWRDYPNLLEFFVRRLKPDARPVDPSPDTVVSPVDGVITQLGEITEGTLIQSKGVTYRLVDLLGGTANRPTDTTAASFSPFTSVRGITIEFTRLSTGK